MSLEEIKKCGNPHGLYAYIVNQFSFILVDLLDKIKFVNVTPNHLTSLNFLSILVFVYCIFNKNFILAAIILNIANIFDTMDGIWARYKKKTSDFGAIFDPLVDRYNSILIFFSLGIYAYLAFDNFVFLVLPGILFTFSHLPHEFKYYLEKYKVENVKVGGRKSLISKIIFEIFANDKFFIILPVVLIFFNTEIGFLAFFCYEILKRILWTVKMNYAIARMYFNKK